MVITALALNLIFWLSCAIWGKWGNQPARFLAFILGAPTCIALLESVGLLK